jgi:hypothetical protein
MIALVFEARLKDLDKFWDSGAVLTPANLTDAVNICPHLGNEGVKVRLLGKRSRLCNTSHDCACGECKHPSDFELRYSHCPNMFHHRTPMLSSYQSEVKVHGDWSKIKARLLCR